MAVAFIGSVEDRLRIREMMDSYSDAVLVRRRDAQWLQRRVPRSAHLT
jgi:hypothetical protein